MTDLLVKYGAPVPRYTSYPTAPHFHQGVNAEIYRRWLSALDPGETLSLYLHIPFCRSLCWFCGCHTKMVRRYEPVARYMNVLRREIDLVVEALGARFSVGYVHWGGGTPMILRADHFLSLSSHLRERFDGLDRAEIAVEIDPRELTRETVRALREGGVTRASLGVQDFDADVQRAVNRIQPYEMTARSVDWLRKAGIEGINFDLMYGLPRQTVPGVVETAERAARLGPRRLALFGYAHVPWLKRHQRLIDEAELPDASERFRQFRAASERLVEHGYVKVGLDHFALAGDSMTKALREGRLRRNFQGYTTDQSATLLGFGASAIGSLSQGYVQNAAPIHAYGEAVSKGRLAVVRGVEVDRDDLLRREIIERLMCDMRVDLDRVCARHARSPALFAAELVRLGEMERDGLIRRRAHRIEVVERGRPLARAVCAVFDRYISTGEARYSKVV